MSTECVKLRLGGGFLGFFGRPLGVALGALLLLLLPCGLLGGCFLTPFGGLPFLVGDFLLNFLLLGLIGGGFLASFGGLPFFVGDFPFALGGLGRFFGAVLSRLLLLLCGTQRRVGCALLLFGLDVGAFGFALKFARRNIVIARIDQRLGATLLGLVEAAADQKLVVAGILLDDEIPFGVVAHLRCARALRVGFFERLRHGGGRSALGVQGGAKQQRADQPGAGQRAMNVHGVSSGAVN